MSTKLNEQSPQPHKYVALSTDPSRGKPNVVLIDDNKLLLTAMYRWLRQEMQWEALCFSNPADALSYLQSGRYLPVDIFIVDLKMPNLNGIEFIREIRKTHEDALQILMTGHEYHDAVVEAVNDLDLFFFMEKPWEPKKFSLILMHAWDKQKLSASLEKRIYAFEDTVRKLQTVQVDLVRHKNQAAIGELIQGICHNLNTPLGAIMGHVELIQMRLEQAQGGMLEISKVERSVRLIHEASERLSNIVSNLMIKSRMEQTPKRQFIALDRLIHQEMDFLQADHFLKHRVQVVIEIEPELPELFINYAEFSQVFGNLVRNALDAVSEVESPQLEIKTYNGEDSIIIEIHDNGPGVPENLRTEIFTPFFTTKIPVDSIQHEEDSSAQSLRSHGVGLGLYSVVQLLEPYKGHIEVLDSHLTGACFRVHLPRLLQTDNPTE